MNHFYAYVSRMKLIQRWALMHNVRKENVQEHSLQVAIIAHALSVVGNKYFKKSYNQERVALLSVYHDATEVLTGDLPTPVKYYNPEIREAYKAIENSATDKLLSLLPEDLIPEYKDIFKMKDEDSQLWKLVKAADSLCAYIKCLEEAAAGNKEFNQAKIAIEDTLKKMEMPEVEYFLKHFIGSFSLSLDEMSI